jgi:hypothetical protein
MSKQDAEAESASQVMLTQVLPMAHNGVRLYHISQLGELLSLSSLSLVNAQLRLNGAATIIAHWMVPARRPIERRNLDNA